MRLLLPAALLCSSVAIATDDRAADAVRLRLQLAPARELVYRVGMERTVVRKGQERLPFRTRIGYTFRFRPFDMTNGHTRLRFRFDRLEWQVAGTPNDLALDTAAPAQAGEPAEAALLRGVIGRDFFVTMDDRGQVTELAGLQELLAKQQGTAANPGRGEELLGQNQLQNVLRSLFSWIPEPPVALRQAWHREEVLPLGVLEVVRHNTLALTRLQGERATIVSRIDVAGRPTKKAAAARAGLAAELIPNQPGNATIVFNHAAGVLESVTADVSFGLRMTLPPADRGGEKTVTEQTLFARIDARLISAEAIDPQP